MTTPTVTKHLQPTTPRRRENEGSKIVGSDSDGERVLHRYWEDFQRDFAVYARKHAGEEEAEDALQETFAWAWARREAFSDRYGRQGAFGWMHAILRRVCYEAQRAARTNPIVLGSAAGSDSDGGNIGENKPDTAEPVESQAIAAVEREAEREYVRRLIAIANLSDLQREVVSSIWRREEVPSIARRMGLSDANVRAHLSCAIARLRGDNDEWDSPFIPE